MKHSELSIARSFTAFQCQISGTIMARSTVTRWYSVCALNFNGDQGDRFEVNSESWTQLKGSNEINLVLKKRPID